MQAQDKGSALFPKDLLQLIGRDLTLRHGTAQHAECFILCVNPLRSLKVTGRGNTHSHYVACTTVCTVTMYHARQCDTISACDLGLDRLSGLVVRVPGYRPRGPGFDSPRCQIF
jgi:hypothetical protein